MMLSCEMTQSEPTLGIRQHWDQSFIGEDDQELRRLSDQLLSHFQNVRYQNVSETKPANRTGSDQQIGREAEDVNSTQCLDKLVVPQSGARNISLRTNLSPMSLRAHTADTSSTIAQVALSRLKQSGFYYGSISPSKARLLLQPHPPGTFLVRASSHQHFLFSLTVRTSDCVSGRTSTSVRIELLDTGKFRLDGEKPGSHLLPSSACVLDLLRRHVLEHGVARGEFVLLNGGHPCRETPMFLRRPLYCDRHPATLKHLCRRQIHSALAGRDVDRLYLVPSLKQYLNEYPSDL